MLKKSLTLVLLIFISSFSIAQRAKDGSFTATTTNQIVNSYTFLTANANANTSTLTVNNSSLTNLILTSPLSQGDLLLIIQMQGATMDVNVTPTVDWGGNYTTANGFITTPGWNSPWEWGQVTNYNQAGKFEYVQVASVPSATTINLTCGLKNNYVSSGKVQVIRVPRFSNVTINSGASITCQTWNGQIGGVLAMEIDQNIQIQQNALLTVSGKGFRGGQSNDVASNGSFSGSDPLQVGYFGTNSNTEGAEKGEGIGGYMTEYNALYSRYGKGAPANGGGGGYNHNAGGGGGSNVGTGTYTGIGVPSPTYTAFWNLELVPIGGITSPGGGRGGYTYSTSNQNEAVVGPNNNLWSGDKRRNDGGLGGHPLLYDETRIFMGGGGGAGDQNFTTAPNQVGIGGAGGGIIFLDVYGTISGSGTIEANGANGGSSNPNNITNPAPNQKVGNDGAGGAGAGGSIRIFHSNALPTSIALRANGGNGGNQAFYAGAFAPSPTMEADGPGGGGAGGLISISTGTATLEVNGGANGVTNSSHVSSFPPNGATSGSTGLSNTDVDFFDLTAENDTLCASASTTLTATIIGNQPISSTIGWYSDAYSGTPIATGTSFATPVLTTTTTYYVGICPGHYRKPVTVLVGSNPVISGVAQISDVTCSGNDGAITGLTASGGTAPLTYDWNGTPSSDANLTGSNAGIYTLTVTDNSGCSSTSGPYTIASAGGPTIDVTNIIITPSSCTANTGSITGITQSGGNSFTWNGNTVSQLDLTNLAPGQYNLIVTDINGCQANAGPFTIGSPAGPTIDETNVSITQTTCGLDNGSISGIVTNGVNVSFSWNNVNYPSQDVTDLSPGSYQLTITDNQGCTANSSVFQIDGSTNPIIDINAQITNASCNQSNGEISAIQVTGGVAPYTYQWSNNQNSASITNLSAGSYTLTVTDALGCVDTETFLVNSTNGPVINTDNLLITNESCNGNDGSITGITATGSGLIYSWNSNPSTLNLTNIQAGTYTLTVVDENNCVSQAGPFIVPGSPVLEIYETNLTVVHTTCGNANGSISGITISDNNATISWTNSSETTLNLSNLNPGTYILSITNSDGCTSSSTPIIINPSNTIQVDFTYLPSNPEAGQTVQFTDNSDPNVITWEWTIDGNTFLTENTSYTFNEPGTYLVVLEGWDATNCYNLTQQTIQIGGEIVIPNVMTVNGDGINDVFEIQGLKAETHILIVNRWGNPVYESSNYNNMWNGKDQQGNVLATGVYTYRLETKNGEIFHGFIHLYNK